MDTQKIPEEILLEAIFGRPAEHGPKETSRGEENNPGTETLKDRVGAALKTLTHREREIVKLRYGIADGHAYTLEELSQMFKVTRERVRQVEIRAIRKLQHPLRARKFEGLVLSDQELPKAS